MAPAFRAIFLSCILLSSFAACVAALPLEDADTALTRVTLLRPFGFCARSPPKERPTPS